MTNGQKIGILIYILVIIQNVSTLTALLFKVKKTPAKTSLVACNVSIILWLILGIFEILFQNTEIFPQYVRYIVINLYFLGPLWLLFTFDHLEVIKPGQRYIRLLIFVPAIISAIPSFFDSMLHLTIKRIDNLQIVAEWGILLYLNTYIMFIFIFISAVLLISRSFADKSLIRIRILIIIAVFIPAITVLLNHFRLLPDLQINSVPITLSILTGVMAMAIFKYKILDLKPLASNEVYHIINDAVLIVDKTGTIVEINPAGYEIFAIDNEDQIIKNIYDFFTELSQKNDLDSLIANLDAAISLDQPSVISQLLNFRNRQGISREFTCSFIPLHNQQGQSVGSIITFSDVTEIGISKIASERIRMAGDLHDSIGHNLNTIIMRLEYILKMEKFDEEARQLVHSSYENSISALVDLRRIVHELRPLDIEKIGLVAALESLFSNKILSNITVKFSHMGIDDAAVGNEKLEEVVYFICQEAVHNAISHGNAKQVDVILKNDQESINLYIADDGIGCREITEGNGLTNMRRRVDELRGSFTYGSPSEGGFNLVICLPNRLPA